MQNAKTMIGNLLSFLSANTLASLEEKHGVCYRLSADKTKMSLNYDQIAARDSDLLAQVSRGLILGTMNGMEIDISSPLPDLKVIAFPFCRFFNYGQESAAPVDLDANDTQFLAKLDGTCIILYYDLFKGEWFVATRSVSEADVPLANGMTFRALVERTTQEMFGKTLQETCADMDKNVTYVLELTGPYNRIVCEYMDNKLTLLGARNMQTFEEIMPEVAGTPFPVVHGFSFGNITDMLAFVNEMNPTENEGIVVRDRHFRRVKVKSMAYVFAHKSIDKLSTNPRNLLEIILLDKLDDVVAVLADPIKKDANEMMDSLNKFYIIVDKNYDICHKISSVDLVNSRKNFCLEAQRNKFWLAPLIERFLGKCENAKDFVHKKLGKDGCYPDAFLDNILAQIKWKL